MQRLQGIIVGVAADAQINKDELVSLRQWMDGHQHLRTCWPYDEIEALITAVLRDGVIDETEHNNLVRFFNEFAECPGHHALELPEDDSESIVSGICAMCPEIDFHGQEFCFTGNSERFNTQDEFGEAIIRLGGIYSKTLTKSIDYLTIGADGNDCWSYACYGRKVEKAIEYRKGGCNILIVHEYDVWDALSDL